MPDESTYWLITVVIWMTGLIVTDFVPLQIDMAEVGFTLLFFTFLYSSTRGDDHA